MCQSDLYEKKYPGEFRNSPVWIGPEGCNLKNALFVPPTEEDMTEAFSELEKFIHEESGLHILIRAALIHYQLRPSILHRCQRTNRPIAPPSLSVRPQGHPETGFHLFLHFREVRRYYTELQKVHESGAYESWVIFFLQTLKEAAQQTTRFLSTTPPSFG